MTNPTPHGQVPEALIDLIDAYAETRHRCGGIYNARTEAARNAVIEALSGVALSAAPGKPSDAEIDEFIDLHCWDANGRRSIVRHAIARWGAAPTTRPAPQQEAQYDHGPQAETVEEAARDVGKWLNERPNRPLDLRHVAMLAHYATAPQQEAQEPCPTCAALARTVMLDQVSFDRKPDCYGIRQVTDDESVEEWEDIRTSPDVAREEANDMMATGRGEIYEVVPLWTTPQPSLTAKAADSVLEDAARLDWLALAGPTSICVVIDRPHDGEVEVSTDDVTGYGKTLREAIDAALAAQGGNK